MENQEKDNVLVTTNENTAPNELKKKLFEVMVHCLFSALNYIINDGNFDVNNAQSDNQRLRNVLALSIEGNADMFNEILLETPPHYYAERIRNPEICGGDIEIRVFKMLYYIEIRIVNLTTGTSY